MLTPRWRWEKNVLELSLRPKKMDPKTVRKWFEQIENDERYREFFAKLGAEEWFLDIMASVESLLWGLERGDDLRYLMIQYAMRGGSLRVLRTLRHGH